MNSVDKWLFNKSGNAQMHMREGWLLRNTIASYSPWPLALFTQKILWK